MIAKELLEKVFVNSSHSNVIPQTQDDDTDKVEFHYHYKFTFAYSEKIWKEVRHYLGYSTCTHCLRDDCICKDNSGNPEKCKQGKCKNGK